MLSEKTSQKHYFKIFLNNVVTWLVDFLECESSFAAFGASYVI